MKHTRHTKRSKKMTPLLNPDGLYVGLDCLMLLEDAGCDQNEIDLIWADSQDLNELITPKKDENNNNR